MNRPIVKIGKWTLTDPECMQICHKIGNPMLEAYELYQIADLPDGKFAIAHGFVYIDDLSEGDIKNIMECYGYESLEEFKESYGDSWQSILAECEFEIESCNLETVVFGTRFDTWKDAQSAIFKMSGYVPDKPERKEVSYDRLVEILHAYVNTDYNSMGTGEPIYWTLREDCKVTDEEMKALGFEWLLDLVKGED